MTSTNDGKDVKSNKSSGPRGKTYYIELYKSLEDRLSEECGLRTRILHLCEAWRHVHSLCLHSAPNTHSHLLAWLQRHTAKTVLQTEWQSPNFKDEHTKLEEAINDLIDETKAASSKRNGTILLWESHLLQRGEWFKTILANPWGHPVLRVLLDPQGNKPSDDEVLEWLKEDRGVMFVTRLRQLVASKCDDLALLLATAVMERVRATTKIVPDDLQTDEAKDNSKSEDGEPSFGDILRTEAGFTADVWELVTDLELVLLHKRDKHPQCIALAKKIPLRIGYQLVERLRSRLASSPHEKKLWKNAKDVAILVAQVVIARCMVVPVCVDVARGALYCCARSLVRLVAASRLPEAAAALAAPAATARHLHTLAAAVHAQSTDTMKPFVCELYVRAITAGLNELEKLKLKTEKESEARSMEQTLSTWFTQLGSLLSESARIQCECTLTAFSVHASPAMYEKIKSAPELPPVVMDIEVKEESKSEFGSWASDSRSQTNFVKTSETLNIKQTQQNNIFSTAILTEGEALGLGAELCQDLTVCLSGPRVKTLSWDMNRSLLLENCRRYMERTSGGTRALTTELKYLNLDPSVYQHLPEEEDNENDLYYGIEKGYEHLVEFPEPEEIWQDAEDFERTDTAYSSETDTDSIIVRRKKKHKKPHLFSDEEDPLSLDTNITNEKKKERPHSKERSKERSKDRGKETKKKDKTPIDPENNQQNKDKHREKSQNKERKKREKKERKKKETTPVEPKPGSLSSLVGMKVMRIPATDQSAPRDLIHGVNISDYDVQVKSMKSSHSENDSNVVFDGLYSMDEIKSPENSDPRDDQSSSSQQTQDSRITVKKTPLMYGIANLDKNKPQSSTYIPGKDQKPPAPANVKSMADNLRLGIPRPQLYGTVNEQVKRSITKLLQFRRQGMKTQAAQTNKPSASVEQKQPTAIQKPDFPLQTFISPKVVNVPEIPKAYINKYQHEGLKSKCEVETPVIQHTANITHSPYVSSEIKKHVVSNLATSIPSHTNTISSHTNSNDILKVPSRHLDINSCHALQQNPINMSTQSRNTIAYGLQTPRLDNSRQSTTLPDGKNLHDLLRELQDSIKDGKTRDIKQASNSNIKKEIKPMSRVPPFIPSTDIKPESTTTLQCAKQITQQKKVENAPNTFSRLSYMHKNKQSDMRSKLARDSMINRKDQLPKQDSSELTRQITAFKSAKQKFLRTMGDTVITRVENCSHSTKSRETTNVTQKSEMQAATKDVPIPNILNTNQISVSQRPISRNDKDIKVAHPPSEYVTTAKPIQSGNQPASKSVKSTYLSEKDQNDLILLLRQQNRINAAGCVSTSLYTNKTEHNTQVLNKPVNDSLNKSSLYPNISKSSPDIYSKSVVCNNGPPLEVNKTKLSNLIIPNTKQDESPTPIENKPEGFIGNSINYSKTASKLADLKNKRIKKNILKNDSSEPMEDWEIVMNAIRAQKTPCRVPSSIDPVQISSSSSLLENNLRNHRIVRPNPTTSTEMTKTTSDPNNQVSIMKTQKSQSTAVLKVNTKELTKLSSLNTQKSPSGGAKIQTKTDIPKRLSLDVPKKQLTCETLKGKDPFISGIENSDYDLLEELMDDDLRQEIGELSSDEDTYRSNTLLHSKGNKSNTGSKNSIANKSTNIFTHKSKTSLKCAKTMQTTSVLKCNYPSKSSIETTAKETIVETKIKSNVTNSNSNTMVKITSKAESNLQTNMERQTTGSSLPNKIADENSCINKDKIVGNTQVSDSRNVYIAAVPPPPPVTANVLVIGADVFYDPFISMQSQMHSGLRNINQTHQYLPSNTSDITFHATPFTAPVVNSLIIGNTIAVPIEAPTAVHCDNVQTSILPVNQPYITIPPMSVHATSFKNVTANVNEPNEVNIQSNNEPDNDQVLRNASHAMQYKACEINSKTSERKVLSEVQENQKLTEKCDVKITRIQKIPSDDTTRDSLNDLENENSESKCSKPLSSIQELHETKVETDQTEVFERLKTKRLAIIQRVINHRSDLPPIPLAYSPLAIKDQMFDKFTDAKKDNNTNGTENYKENKSALQCRRILLRSSNKDIPKMSVNDRNPIGRKTKVRLKDDKQKAIDGVIEESHEKKKKRKKLSVPVKRVSKVVKKSRVKVDKSIKEDKESSITQTSANRVGFEDVDIISSSAADCDILDIEGELIPSKIPNISVMNVSDGNINSAERISGDSIKTKTMGGEKHNEECVHYMDSDSNISPNHKNILLHREPPHKLQKNAKTNENELCSDSLNQNSAHSKSKEHSHGFVDAISKTPEDKNTIGNRKSNRVSTLKQVCVTTTETNNQQINLFEKEDCNSQPVDSDTHVRGENNVVGKRKSNRISKLTSSSKDTTNNSTIETNNESSISVDNRLVMPYIKNINNDVRLNVTETMQSKQTEMPSQVHKIVKQSCTTNKGIRIRNQLSTPIEAVSSNQFTLIEKRPKRPNTKTEIPNLTPISSSEDVSHHKNIKQTCIPDIGMKIPEQPSKPMEAVSKKPSTLYEETKTRIPYVTETSDSEKVAHHKNIKSSCIADKGTKIKAQLPKSIEEKHKRSTFNEKNKRSLLNEKDKTVIPNLTPISGSGNVIHQNIKSHCNSDNVIKITEQQSNIVESVKNKAARSNKSFQDVFEQSPVLNNNTNAKSDVPITVDEDYSVEINNPRKDCVLNTRKRPISDHKNFQSSPRLATSNEQNKSKSVTETNDLAMRSKSNQLQKIKDAATTQELASHCQNSQITKTNQENIKNKMESSDIPQSYKNNISFEELPCNQLDANMKKMRIKLSSGKVFTATVYGKMHMTFDSLFEDPAIRSFLMSDVKEQKKYTLNINQITKRNVNPNKPQETRIQNIQVYSTNIVPHTIETINLLSDEEEDEVCNTFRTEFGQYRTSLKDKDLIAQHQIKFDHKCSVKILRLPIPALPIQEDHESDQSAKNFPVSFVEESDILVPEIVIPDVLNSRDRDTNLKEQITTEIIEIDDDSSNDSIDLLKSCLNLPLGLISENLKYKEITDILERNNSIINLNDDQNMTIPKISTLQGPFDENKDGYNILTKSLNCFVKLTKCDDLIHKYKLLEIMKRKCFVQLVRCDDINYDTPQSEIGHDNIKNSLCDQSIDFATDVPDETLSISRLTRCPSLSILNEFASFNELHSDNNRVLVITEDYDRCSPVMEVFEMIASLQNSFKNAKEISGSTQKLTRKCSYNELSSENIQQVIMTKDYHQSSSVMEVFEMMASLQSCSRVAKEVPKISGSSQKLRCKCEWLFTKQQTRAEFHTTNPDRRSFSLLDNNKFTCGKLVCEQTNVKSFQVPSLIYLATAYFQRNGKLFQVPSLVSLMTAYFQNNAKTFRVPTLISLMTAYFQNNTIVSNPFSKYMKNNEINETRITRNLKRKFSDNWNDTIAKKCYKKAENSSVITTESQRNYECDNILFTVESRKATNETIVIKDESTKIGDSYEVPKLIMERIDVKGSDKNSVKEIYCTDISIGQIKFTDILRSVNDEAEVPTQFVEQEKYLKDDYEVPIKGMRTIDVNSNQRNDTVPLIQCISNKEILNRVSKHNNNDDKGAKREIVHNKIVIDENNSICGDIYKFVNNAPRKQNDDEEVDTCELADNLNYFECANKDSSKGIENTEIIADLINVNSDAADSFNTGLPKGTIKGIVSINNIIDQKDSNNDPIINNLIEGKVVTEKHIKDDEEKDNMDIVIADDDRINCDVDIPVNNHVRNESAENLTCLQYANQNVRKETERNETIINSDTNYTISSILSKNIEEEIGSINDVIDQYDVEEAENNELIKEFIPTQTNFKDDEHLKETGSMNVVANNSIITFDLPKFANSELRNKLVESPDIFRYANRDIRKEDEGRAIIYSDADRTVNTVFANNIVERTCSIDAVQSEIKGSQSIDTVKDQSNNTAINIDNSIIKRIWKLISDGRKKGEDIVNEIESTENDNRENKMSDSTGTIMNPSNNVTNNINKSIIKTIREDMSDDPKKDEDTMNEIETIATQNNIPQKLDVDRTVNTGLFEKWLENQNDCEDNDTNEEVYTDINEIQHTKDDSYNNYHIQEFYIGNNGLENISTVTEATNNCAIDVYNIIYNLPEEVIKVSKECKDTTKEIEGQATVIVQDNKPEKTDVNLVNVDVLEKSPEAQNNREGDDTNKEIDIIDVGVNQIQKIRDNSVNNYHIQKTTMYVKNEQETVKSTLDKEKTDLTVYVNVIIDEVDKDEQDKLYNEQLNNITNSVHNSSVPELKHGGIGDNVINNKTDITEELNREVYDDTEIISSKEAQRKTDAVLSDHDNECSANISIFPQAVDVNVVETALLTGDSNDDETTKHSVVKNYANTLKNAICDSILNSQKEGEQVEENTSAIAEKDETKREISENSSVSENVVKNVELLYHGDTDVIIKGIKYDDPVVGMCYVFPMTKNVSVSSDSNVRVLNAGIQEPTDEIIQIIEEIDDDITVTTDEHEDVCEETLKVIIPKITYSKMCQDCEPDLKRVKGKKNLKRKMNAIDPRGSVKKYRKGKNIDYPKSTAAAISDLAYSKEYKRIFDYCSSLKFSYSQPFHKEFIDVEDIVKDWPIKGERSRIDLEVRELCGSRRDCELFIDNEDKPRSELNTLQLTLTEEMSFEYNENIETSTNVNETNFNMGFGEGSGRVIQNLGNVDYISKVSAATLSDVKQTQPFLLSEDYDDCDDNFADVNANYDQIEKAKRYVTYIQLRDKVRSFFKQTTIALKHEWLMQNKKLDCTNFPFDHYIRDFIEPCPVEAVVQVVQVGQLPVSAAAQNPVTCDPRVTQVSDASPSQCSVENSPHDDSPSAIKTEYTELTTADLTLPLVQDYAQHTPTLPMESHEPQKVQMTDENIPIETEIKSIVKIELMEELPEEKEEESLEPQDSTDAHTLPDKHLNDVEYSYDTNNTNAVLDNSNLRTMYISPERRPEPENFSQQPVIENFPRQTVPETFPQQKQHNGSAEKTDQIAHAMNAAGITTASETIANTRAQALVNILSQKMRQGVPVNTQTTNSSYSKATSINAMALQQALAQILPPPLNQTNAAENNQQTSNTQVTPQVLHIVQGKNATGSQITLVDNSQQSVISGSNATPVLHIVQNKSGTAGTTTNGAPVGQTNSFSGLSLVDAGLQQGGNQLLHIVNTGGQKNNNAGQLLKRVNLLTNLANVQGSNDQKMVQFVCKSADGKAIQLNAPHQRSMVLRLQPIESPNVQPPTPKPVENQELNQSSTTSTTLVNKDNTTQQEIKSRSVYEENYAKFIQSSNKPATVPVDTVKATSLPKFNQAFGKAVFQEGNQKPNEITANNMSSVNTGTTSENTDCQTNDNTMNLDHIDQISSPPLLLRKSTATSQSQPNLVQQIKQTIAPMNIQTMHGGVIYTRQIPVNIGGGQTINLITVPSTELIDDSGQKQQAVNQGEIEPSIIKIVPQSQTAPNSELSTDDNSNAHIGATSENGATPQPQTQPVLTQMRIKLPMLSKTPQMVSGARVVRPSFFQIQRNVIGGANQPVYQQLVLTAAPPLGQQTIRLPQAQANRQIKVPTENQSGESQMSSSTLEQLREFDMVLEQVKERSTVQPNINTNTFSKLHTSSADTTDNASSASTAPAEPTQVLYSIGNNQSLNVTYVNRKTTVTTPTTSTYVRSPDSSGIADSPTSSTHVQIPHTVTTEAPVGETTAQPKPAKVGSKSKSRPKSSSHLSSSMKLNSVPPKTTTQKPLEDEQTTQRILYILAEYKEQVENSPDKDKPAPRRRSNPPSNPSGSSKRKKSSSSSRRPGHRDMSPVHGDDTCRTMGSEDSSCGTSQGDCNENCLDSHSPQDSPRKIVRKLTFEQETPIVQPRPQPPRNVIVADGQTITVARGTTGKPTTAVLMPANYILPVSMVKGGQQIAIVTNRGPKLLTVGGGEAGATNALLLQRLIGPAGLKPVLTRPGVRHVRLPTAALHNLQAFNLATATTIQPPDSTASPAPAPTPPELVETRATASSPWTDRESQDVKPERGSSPEGSESWNLQSSADPHEYTYEETVRADNMDRTVLVVHKKDGTSHRQHRLTHVSAAALRHKYAILEHELRLQKSLSEECEDLGVDSPSASELFPEAELLFAASPAHDHTTQDQVHHQSHTPQPTILNQSCIPQPDIDDQIATDQLLQRDMHDGRSDLNLGLEDVGIVTVSEDGMQATIQLDHEEFAKSHPNTTFHSEPTEEGEVQPFTITGLKGRHITSTIFHSNRAPATVLMTAPQTTVISQATGEASGGVKYINTDIDNMINSLPSSHGNNINLSSVLVKDDGLTRFDNILNDSRELHLTNTASAIVHSTGNATQVIRRVCYDDKRDRDTSFLMDEPDALIAGDDAKMVGEDSSRDATLESMTGDVDDDRSSPERHTELFWESNSASERSESRRPLDFSSDSDKCCKSPSYDETNSTDSSGVGTHMRLDSVIKEARGIDRSGSADGSSADDTHPPLRTYPPKRMYHPLDGDMERSLTGKTRAGERSPDLEIRRRASGRGVVKRGCHCCNGSPAPPRPKKSRQRKPTLDFSTH